MLGVMPYQISGYLVGGGLEHLHRRKGIALEAADRFWVGSVANHMGVPLYGKLKASARTCM